MIFMKDEKHLRIPSQNKLNFVIKHKKPIISILLSPILIFFTILLNEKDIGINNTINRMIEIGFIAYIGFWGLKVQLLWYDKKITTKEYLLVIIIWFSLSLIFLLIGVTLIDV